MHVSEAEALDCYLLADHTGPNTILWRRVLVLLEDTRLLLGYTAVLTSTWVFVCFL